MHWHPYIRAWLQPVADIAVPSAFPEKQACWGYKQMPRSCHSSQPAILKWELTWRARLLDTPRSS